MKKRFSLIAAVDKNNAIGKENKMPWHIPEDLVYFQNHTLNKMVVMGRKTFESIGHPLPRRKNVVLTQKPLQFRNVLTAHNWQQVEDLADYQGIPEEVMVAGGEEIYNLALPYATTIYLTKIPEIISGADTYFPEISPNEWVLKEEQSATTQNNGEITFQIWERTL